MWDGVGEDLPEALVDTRRLERLAEVARGLEEQAGGLDLAGGIRCHGAMLPAAAGKRERPSARGRETATFNASPSSSANVRVTRLQPLHGCAERSRNASGGSRKLNAGVR